MTEQFDAIVIGSGFGGAVAIATLSKTPIDGRERKILVLERGTWWRNPEGPGLRKYKTTSASILGKWQYWARPNDSQGLVYVANSIYKEHNPIWDAVNPAFKDNDLGAKRNRKGMYRLTRFSHKNGNVDVVSGSAVGGGSLFYSGVNLIPHKPVLDRIGLGHLTSEDFRNAGNWMKKFRGKINKVNTKTPIPHYIPEPEVIEANPQNYYQLGIIPESGDPVPAKLDYEMPNPDLAGKHDEDFLLLDRARVLKRAMTRVVASGGFRDGAAKGKLSGQFEPLPLSVVEYDKEAGSDSSKKNTFCGREGRCILGCLPSARHTLYKTIQNLQGDDNDITVLPLTKVSHIDRVGPEDYVVHFESRLDGEEGKLTQARAPQVYLAAGCLGTVEVMLRSKELHDRSGGQRGLPLSSNVGKSFSTNGDFFAFSYNLARDYKTRREVPDADRIGNANPTVGPINSSHFYVVFDGDDPQSRVDVNVEDAGIPTTFSRLVHGLLPHFSDWEQFVTLAKALLKILLNMDPFSTIDAPETDEREQASYLTERELLANVFFYNLMGSAAGEPLGTFSLQRDGSGLDLSYEDGLKLAEWSVFQRHDAVLRQLTDSMADKGEEPGRAPILAHSPFWLNEKRVTVVHPLGGCSVGPDSASGVVDEFGRVFDGEKPQGSTDLLDGLFVLDASAIPGALGVNPTFTIVTHAVRCMSKAL